MKRITTLGAALIAAAFTANIVHAGVIKTVPVSATLEGLKSLTADILKIADNNPDVALAFGSVPANPGVWANQPGQYVKVTVQDTDDLNWRLSTYTNNFAAAPSTTTWGGQYGGMKGTRDGAKVPMGWIVNTSTIPTGPALGDPQYGRVVDADKKVLPASNGFTYLKDKWDIDLSTITAGTDNDTGFATSDAAGYTNVAFGSPSYTRISRPNIQDGNEALPTIVTPFFYYVEGNFSGAVADSYSTTINLDLIGS